MLKCLSLKRGIMWTNIYIVHKISTKIYYVIFTMIPDGMQNSISVTEGVLEIFCLKCFPWVQCLSLKRAIIWTNIYKIPPKVNQFIFTMISDCLQNFMSIVQVVPWIFCLQYFSMLKCPSLKRGVIWTNIYKISPKVNP